MEQKDPIEALESFYRHADKAKAPGMAFRRQTRSLLVLAKAASACAAGIVLAVLLTSSAAPQLKEPSMPIAEADMRARFVKSGLNPDDFIDTPKMRSQIEGDKTWRV